MAGLSIWRVPSQLAAAGAAVRKRSAILRLVADHLANRPVHRAVAMLRNAVDNCKPDILARIDAAAKELRLRQHCDMFELF
eukprot:COSAG06_NODE_40044_length_406_cov_0.768730_1_plen_81_part_00